MPINRNTNEEEVNSRRKKNRRGKNRFKARNINSNNIKIWYNNINGIISKKSSLIEILARETPHIVAVAETKVNKNPKITGYTWISEYKPNKAGGVAIAARNDIANNVNIINIEKIPFEL